MLTLPLALVGAILALFLAKQTISMGSSIGIILLMGLVTKNAILLLDRAIVRVRDHGEAPLQAILKRGLSGPADPDDERGDDSPDAADRDFARGGKRVSCADGDRGHRRRDQLDLCSG